MRWRHLIRRGKSLLMPASRVAWAAAALPPLHRDPVGRVIVALARSCGITVPTADENIRQYPGVTTLW